MAGVGVDLRETAAEAWSRWNLQLYSAYGGSIATLTTNALTTDQQVWRHWVMRESWTAATTNTITLTGNAEAWGRWNAGWIAPRSAPPISLAEREQRRERERGYQARLEEEHRKRQEAECKAEALLLQNLSLEQREMYRQRGFFYLFVGEKRYRINRGHAGNVDLVDEKNEAVERFCIHPRNEFEVPAGDAMLAQKLLLESDEETFRRVANITRLKPRPNEQPIVHGTGEARA